MNRFENNLFTDEALLYCLSTVDYGYQYVLKTEKGCGCAEIIQEQPLKGLEKDQARKYNKDRREEGIAALDRAAARFNRDGHFLSEILENPDLLMPQKQLHRP